MAENPLLARFTEHPSMLAPEWAQSLEANITLFMNLPHASDMLADASAPMSDAFWPDPDSWQASYRPYNVSSDGILTIPVSGVMLNNFSYGTSYATGYQYLAKAWERGMADPAVKGIALNINSGGGMAAGNIDLADKMTSTKTKPTKAVCEFACSAAYAIACTADSIETSRTGIVGSIGVVIGHMDASEAMKQRGIKMTFISAPEGGDKTEGNSSEPLSAGARGRMQDQCDELYEHFASLVAQNRSMSVTAVRQTKARTFTASQATSNGLADKVCSAEASMADFSAALNSSDGEMKMSAENTGTVDMAAHETAVAAARAEGTDAGATAERVRISAIIAHAEAAERPAAAMALAMDSDMSVEASAAFLAKLPKEAPVAAAQSAEDIAKAEAEAKVKADAAKAEADKAAAAEHRRPDFAANMTGAGVEANVLGADGVEVPRHKAILAMAAGQGLAGSRTAEAYKKALHA